MTRRSTPNSKRCKKAKRRSTPNSAKSKNAKQRRRPQSKSKSTRSSRAVRRGALSARATRRQQSHRNRKSLPRLLQGGVTPDSDSGNADEDSISDTWYELDPVKTSPPSEEELERRASEDRREKVVEFEVQRLKDEEWLRNFRVQEQEKARETAQAQALKKARSDKGQKARVPVFNRCPDDTRARLHNFFVVYREWGYGTGLGGGHGAYEAATHGDFTGYQPLTDPLMRGLLNVDNTGTVFLNDIMGLTPRLSSSLSYFESQGAGTQRYLSEILRPYMETPGIKTKLLELSHLGRSEAGDGGNQCLWYLGVCASNILSFNDGDYVSIGETNEEIGARFGFNPVPESNKRQKRK